MSFGLSPSIDIRERDFLSPGRQTANRFAGAVGNFNWGPVGERIFTVDEKALLLAFNPPDAANRSDWMCMANYLAYNDKLYVVRALKEAGSYNAGVAVFSESLKKLDLSTVLLAYEVGEDVKVVDGEATSATGTIVAIEGASLFVKVLTGVFAEDDAVIGIHSGASGNLDTITDAMKSCKFKALKKNLSEELTVADEDFIKFKFLAKYPGLYGNRISVAVANSTNFATANIIGTTKFKSVFEFAPKSTEVAIAILLNGVIVETWLLSTVVGAKNFKGELYYIESYLANYSNYVYVYDNHTIATVASFEAITLGEGAHVAPEAADYIIGYSLFDNKEEVDVDVIFETGCVDITSGSTVAAHIIDNVLEKRKDCRGVFGPMKTSIVNIAIATAVSNMLTYAGTTLAKDSTYAAFYGNYKYQYDRYNDEYVWVPITGDVAGVYSVGQTWEAPAGANRGVIKNCVKLAINPSESYRDLMYPAAINPIHTLKNVGHIVVGQKTMKTSSPSLFSRVDIRGLFILLEKNAEDVARFYQFQKNTAIERRRFVADVEPLFKQVLGLGGIEEYLIICDESNNTATMIDNNTMVADFYVKPAQTSEWIRLNFNATANSVNFEEIIASPYTV